MFYHAYCEPLHHDYALSMYKIAKDIFHFKQFSWLAKFNKSYINVIHARSKYVLIPNIQTLNIQQTININDFFKT